MPNRRSAVVLSILLVSLPLAANGPERGASYAITRAPGPITVDGSLDDAGWQGAMTVETWYETNPGDNVPPKVRNVARVTYDDRFFYAAFELQDPDPRKIRAPFTDRDNVSGETDYAGVILDTRNDARSAILFLANPRGIQYDAVQDEGSGNEDSSPDFFWDSAARITATGWTLEIRIPFSSLRYPHADPQTWGVLLYRNYPRDFRYQMFSARLPRGESCFICHQNSLTGLTGLPRGGNLVVAPYVSASEEGVPRDGLGSELVNRPIDVKAGLDVKWTPSASTVLDATLKPDFSQIESDVAQISTNERFALFYPEKRPFFLEGVDLLTTPIQAVYTRSITSPRWGVRGTGKVGDTSVTALVVEDKGGGSVILPGPNGSDFADQDVSSIVAIGRVRHSLGSSFAGLLVTDREVSGGGYNRVVGPDFQWRPTGSDTVMGQLLLSSTQTPNRPELAAEWDGRRLSSAAGILWYSHNSKTLDLFGQYQQLGDDFRADDGFVPQVGFRETYLEGGWTFRPTKGAVRRLRVYVIGDASARLDGAVLFRQVSPGLGLDAKWNSFVRVRMAYDRIRAGDSVFSRRQLVYTIQASPSGRVSGLSLDGFLGEQIDFANERPGHGGRVTLTGTLRPTDRVELRLNAERRWLDVRPFAGGDESRLFTADLGRLKATYTFSSRSFLRLIGQWVETRRDPSLYGFGVERRSGELSGSALFAYKLNWQTVLFLGYGDNRALTEDEHLEKAGRQVFLKISYALQL